MKNRKKEIRQKAYSLLASGEYEKVADLFLKADDDDPHFGWYLLFLGDIYRYYLDNGKEALMVYETCYKRGIDSFNTTTLSPLRYLLKRLSEMYYKLEKYEQAIPYFEKFISFTPSNFHENDFCEYADSLLKTNQKEKAIEILTLGTRYSKSRRIRRMLNDITGVSSLIEEFPVVRAGYERIPIKTKILRPGDSIPESVELYTREIRKPGDIITVASAVTALTERRIRCVDEIEPSFFATKLATYVHNDNFPFGGNAPLCNPLSMQVAIEEQGFWRILFSAFFGGILGKIWKGSGMFYRLAGEQTALIDDMPGAIPPFDYYVILGPSDSRDIANQIKEKTGCDAAIMDANDLEIAWAVGCSDPKQKKLIEEVMKDNPAGNGDQTTPIVLLRKSDCLPRP
jgi:tetratricopeptide (TPR) repeat protein